KQQWLLFKAKDEHADAKLDIVASRPESVASGRRLTRGPEPAKVLGKPQLTVGNPAHKPSKLPGRDLGGVTPDKLLERVFPPMLATLVAAPPPDEGSWWLEVKYDGFRALAGLAGGRVALQSRNGLDLSGRFPQVARALAEIAVADAVLDGEICALDAR